MEAKELVRTGRLEEAVEEVGRQLRSRPADTRLRFFLFELLCFEGALDRAEKQLEVVRGDENVATALTAEVYRSLLEAERRRRQVFETGAAPACLQDAPPYVSDYLEIVRKMREAPEEVADRLAAAEEAFPQLQGRLGEKPFSSFRDGDDRVAPVLEAFMGATYCWVPFQQIASVMIDEPKSLRDYLWIHAEVQPVGNDSPLDLFLPGLYVGSHSHQDSQVRLGRTTEWEAWRETLVVGHGHRLFMVDDQQVPLLDVRQLFFDHQEPTDS